MLEIRISLDGEIDGMLGGRRQICVIDGKVKRARRTYKNSSAQVIEKR